MLVMFRKHAGHFAMVSLKYFFDLDPGFSNHILVIALLLAGFFRLFVIKVSDNVHEGLLTVKEDTQEIAAEILMLKKRWGNSPVREALVNNIRSFKDNLFEIDVRNWRLK